MSTPVLGVVPVRLESSRLPRKPLYPVLGRPLLEWVWMRVASMDVFQRVVVAVDSKAVLDLCDRMGAPAVMTDPDHPSGTDRVAEVVERPEFREFPVVVNIQGDEPLILAGHLEATVRLVQDGGWEVGTCATPLGTAQARQDPSVVKVVRALSGRALYFSRAPVPHMRDGVPGPEQLSAIPFLRHIGVYAYQRAALQRWVSLPPSPLEELERLEQLRALEAGISVGVAVVDGDSPGVDTVADVEEVEKILTEMGESPN